MAGDWTRSGWPATMEGAVRSGYMAAAAAAKASGGSPVYLIG
jgi:zeta-carotene desaturase